MPGTRPRQYFGELGTKCLCLISSQSLSKLLPTVRLRRLSFTELMSCWYICMCPLWTKHKERERETETSEQQQRQQVNSVSAAVCHQDLLDAVMKDFVGRSSVRMNCLEALEY